MNTIATFALLTPLALFPQGGGSSKPKVVDATIPSSAEVVLQQFFPQHLSSDDLYSYARQNIIRNFRVRDELTGELTLQTSVIPLGGRLVIYERPKAAQRILDTLKSLDTPYANQDKYAGAADLLTKIYRPLHVPIQQLYFALEPYRDKVSVRPGFGFQNITLIDRLGQLVIRDKPERVNEIVDFLAVTDQPTKQVLMTAYLVTAADQAEANSGLPDELVKDLAPLLGAKGLHREAIGLVRTGLGADRQVTLTLQTGSGPPSRLEFAPSALDSNGNGGGSLTLGSCTLMVDDRVAFSTQTSVSLGEFVVLGATGMAPQYLVLHIKAL